MGSGRRGNRVSVEVSACASFLQQAARDYTNFLSTLGGGGVLLSLGTNKERFPYLFAWPFFVVSEGMTPKTTTKTCY